MKIIISIDDTDNKYSKGTGHRARKLGVLLEKKGFISLISISRHQLFFDRRIPYTSHNSSASLFCIAQVEQSKIIATCRRFLKWESAFFSDAGLCVAKLEDVNDSIIEWGHRAKREILYMPEAKELAMASNIYLEGLTGKKIGIIGALAAIGLRAEGNDGRLLWMPQLRTLSGIFKASELKNIIKVEQIITKNGAPIPEESLILKGEWCRPVHLDGKISLIVEKKLNTNDYEFHSTSKEYIKSISQ
ncbi:MAG: hypothetical protein WCH34_01750 [Bacteroidota bacterium]